MAQHNIVVSVTCPWYNVHYNRCIFCHVPAFVTNLKHHYNVVVNQTGETVKPDMPCNIYIYIDTPTRSMYINSKQNHSWITDTFLHILSLTFVVLHLVLEIPSRMHYSCIRILVYSYTWNYVCLFLFGTLLSRLKRQCNDFYTISCTS